jgi:hypothetical protein
MEMGIIITWIIFCFVAGSVGEKRKIGFAKTFLLSLLLSPLIGLIIAFNSDKKTDVIYASPAMTKLINEGDKLVIEKTQATPNFLRHMRGSSTLVEEGGYIWGLTHCVIYKAPRKYYHVVVKIDPETDKIVGYCDPFFFLNNAIEYCLGFEKQENTYTTIVSQNDSTPVLVTFNDDDLRWRTV